MFAWHNTPVGWLAPHLLETTYNGLRHGLRTRRLPYHMNGLAAGWKLALAGAVERKPVELAAYRLFRKLKKSGPLRLADIENSLHTLVK